MTGCERALEAMSARMDGALAAAGGDALREHLASCAGCRARETGIGELRGLLRRLEGVSARPPELVALRVRAALTGKALPENPRAEPRRRTMLIPALAGSTIGLVLAIPLAILVVRSGTPRPAARPPAAAAAPRPAVPAWTPPAPARILPRPEPVAPDPADPPPADVPDTPVEPPPPLEPDPAPPAPRDPEPAPPPPPTPPDQDLPPKALPLPGALEGKADIPQKFSGRAIFVTGNRELIKDLHQVFEKFPGKVQFNCENLPGEGRFQITASFSGPDARELGDFHEKFEKLRKDHEATMESMDWKMDD